MYHRINLSPCYRCDFYYVWSSQGCLHPALLLIVGTTSYRILFSSTVSGFEF
uniref:Uncharacterized protein n=1 Tax=Arundo donax TaxID=35708 RepID=A0A0A8YE14_ARUDO